MPQQLAPEEIELEEYPMPLDPESVRSPGLILYDDLPELISRPPSPSGVSNIEEIEESLYDDLPDLVSFYDFDQFPDQSFEWLPDIVPFFDITRLPNRAPVLRRQYADAPY